MAVISCPSSKPCFTTSVPVAPVAPKTRSLSCLKSFSSFSTPEASAICNSNAATFATCRLAHAHDQTLVLKIAKNLKNYTFYTPALSYIAK